MKLQELKKIFEKIVADLNLSFRNTLQKMVAAGKVLIRMKEQCIREQVLWLDWLKKIKCKERTAATWMQIATAYDANPPAPADKTLTAEKFLMLVRDAKADAKQNAMEDYRRKEAAKAGNVKADKRYRLHHADAMKFQWPSPLDMIAADPPWKDMDCYQWLGKFAATHLRLDGGLLLVQSDQVRLPKHLDILREAGLTYRWTMAIVYHWNKRSQQFQTWVPSWRPVLVFSRGKMPRSRLSTSDTITVTAFPALHHRWQQPLKPWQHWLGKLTKPGQTIADPFAGSATCGVAVKSLGGRYYIGTEIDKLSYEVAKVRLAEKVDSPRKE